MSNLSNLQQFLNFVNINEKRKRNLKQVSYFKRTEAQDRDRILLKYFGEDGVNKIIGEVTAKIFELEKERLKILDVGAAQGFSRVKFLKKLGTRK